MAAEKEDIFRKTLVGRGAKGAFGATSIGDQRMARNVAGDLRQAFDGQPDRQGNINEVRSFYDLLQLRAGLIHDAQLECAFEHVWFVPTRNADPGKHLPHSKGKGAANQSCSEHGNSACAQHCSARDERSHHAAILRPTAGAIMRNSAINCSNCWKWSDCAPSDSACSGSLWTSSSRPSAPAATAARAMGATLSRRPVPCAGSARMGRGATSVITAMARISRLSRL